MAFTAGGGGVLLCYGGLMLAGGNGLFFEGIGVFAF
jgi:hypothetical protein